MKSLHLAAAIGAAIAALLVIRRKLGGSPGSGIGPSAPGSSYVPPGFVPTIASLPDVPGLAKMPPEFLVGMARLVANLGWTQEHADVIAALMSHESGFRADAVNQYGGATGLIQFMPATAKSVGTTVEALRGMTALEQLPFVEAYFRPVKKLAPRDIPMMGLGKGVGQGDDVVAFEAGQKGYDWNKALDLNKDGKLTLGEVRRDVLKVLDGRGRIPVPGAPLA